MADDRNDDQDKLDIAAVATEDTNEQKAPDKAKEGTKRPEEPGKEYGKKASEPSKDAGYKVEVAGK